ncbi:MAG: preprotein translocase subunit SecY [Candidatus Bathyarchaeota archaeon]|jgi:preprotein translocase subunit SecY/protein transport protein SEC61 subunit alpha
MPGRFLSVFEPLSRVILEVKRPERRVGFNEKLFWTGLALVLYLVMTVVPLYGIETGEGGDPFSYMRVIFASQRGSLMELGIGPIVTAGLILQLLAGSGMIGCNLSDPKDRELFTVASKFFSLILIGVQASAYIIGGVYGVLDPRAAVFIFIQLMIAGLVLMLLDEMIQKGWGFGSGISLFILAGVAQNVLWMTISPVFSGQPSDPYYGAIPALIHNLVSGQLTLQIAFVRDPSHLPALLGLFTTVAVFLIVIYVEGIRVELPISHANYRGYRGRYPIKLLYVSNLPVIFASALFANVYFISQIIWSNYNPGNTNPWLNLLGMYRQTEQGLQPFGGLVYFVLAPRSIGDVIINPVRAVVFTGIMVTFCVVFSLTWLEVGGLGPSTVARQLVDSGMQIPGFRRSGKPIEMVLKRYIPTVTILGGALVGFIAAVADFFGVFGSGMGVLLSVGILYQYYQILMQERVSEMYPALRRFFGG